jgi:hypothetical protein
MTKGTKSTIIIVVISLLIIVFGVLYFKKSIFNRYSPPEITVTKNEITSSGGFSEPVAIERLKVDSFGKEKRPAKYTIEYVATCVIKQKDSEAPTALKTIQLNEAGTYNWSGQNARISIIHPDGFSKRINSAQTSISMGQPTFAICPLKFESGNWYFVNFQDPVFIGVYVYVDTSGVLQQYAAYSDRSPVK